MIKQTLLGEFLHEAENTRKLLKAIPDSALDFKPSEINWTTARVIRSFLYNHLYHHRGELVVYLRSTGHKVPGLYGPTADDKF